MSRVRFKAKQWGSIYIELLLVIPIILIVLSALTDYALNVSELIWINRASYESAYLGISTDPQSKVSQSTQRFNFLFAMHNKLRTRAQRWNIFGSTDYSYDAVNRIFKVAIPVKREGIFSNEYLQGSIGSVIQGSDLFSVSTQVNAAEGFTNPTNLFDNAGNPLATTLTSIQHFQ